MGQLFQNLDEAENTMAVAMSWTNSVADLTLTIAIVAVLLWLVVKKKFSSLSCHFKLTLTLLLVCQVSFVAKDTYSIRSVLPTSDLCSREVLNIADAVGFYLFAVCHWHFSSHYLKVSCLFKLAFQ